MTFKDKFGVSRQIVPAVTMMRCWDPKRSKGVMEAMSQMLKRRGPANCGNWDAPPAAKLKL